MTIKFFKSFAVILFLLIFQKNYSQTIAIESKLFNDEIGLSLYANYIHKDSRGILWMGTQFGLYRFDGKEFRHFDGKNGLPFREVMEIYEDAEGWFWLFKSCFGKPICERNLAFFHPVTLEVQTFEERFGNQVTCASADIVSVKQFGKDIYFTANQTLFKWTSGKDLQEIPIYGVSQTPIIWTKTREGIFGGFFREKESLFYVPIDSTGKVLQKPTEFRIWQDDRILKSFIRSINDFESIRFDKFELTIDTAGTLKIDTLDFSLPTGLGQKNTINFDPRFYVQEGAKIFHSELGTTENIQNNPELVTDDYILNLFWVKKAGSANWHLQANWMGYRHSFFDEETVTAWGASPEGVTAYYFKTQYFDQVYQKGEKNNKNLAHAALELDANQFLLKIGQSFYIFDKTKKTALSIILPNEFPATHSKLIKDENEETLWTSFRSGVAKINRTDFSLQFFLPTEKITQTRCLFQWGNRIWIGKQNGIILFDDVTKEFQEFSYSGLAKELKNARVHFFKQEGEKHLWIGSDKGLFLYEKDRGIIAQYSDTKEGQFYLSANNFFSMNEAKKGGYWLATMSGLIHLSIKDFKKQTIDFQHITKLPSSELLAAFEDDFGFVWMPTAHGLIQYQIETGFSKLYQKSEGLSSSGFQEYTHIQAMDGTLVLGGYLGFNIFHPKHFKNINFQPEVPLLITEFEQHVNKSNQIENRLEDILASGKIILRSGDKLFNIRVALADYRAAEKHRFAYKIEGYRDEWQEGTSNLIRISGLPYGNFKLKIRGQLHDGRVGHPILEIPIEVLRPFYLQTWFFVSLILLFLISTFSIYVWRTKVLTDRQKELEREVANATKLIREQNIELKKLDKIKTNFFANVSHELRTPLTLILAPLQNTLKKRKLDKQDFINLSLAKENGQRLMKLVNEILDLTKLEAGKIELKPTVLVLYNFLRKILANFESLANRKKINFHFRYDANKNLQVLLDPKKVESILYNLLSNAFKFTPNGGTISVEIKDKRGYLIIRVKDTGRGISTDELPNIFKRFYQSKQNTLAEGGTGIGLALSKELTYLMEGELRAVSEIGKGTEFILKLPRIEIVSQVSSEEAILPKQPLQNEQLENTIQPSQLNKSKSIAGKTILVVEDNVDLQNFLSTLLQSNYQVVTASNGQEALEFLESDTQPNLIISDVMMPIMDGYQFLELVKNNDKFRHLPLIMLTARAAAEDKIQALRMGVDDFLTKPFEEDELLARIENLLKHSQLRQSFQQEIGKDTANNKKGVHLSKDDAQWLEDLEITLLKGVSNSNFSLEGLAYEMSTSRWQLNRRVKQLTGLTTQQYVLEIRLNHARNLLDNREVSSVKALTYEVGVRDIRHFSRQFKKRFGKLPSDYL